MQKELMEALVGKDEQEAILKIRDYLRANSEIFDDSEDEVYHRFEFVGNVIDVVRVMGLGAGLVSKVG